MVYLAEQSPFIAPIRVRDCVQNGEVSLQPQHVLRIPQAADADHYPKVLLGLGRPDYTVCPHAFPGRFDLRSASASRHFVRVNARHLHPHWEKW